MEPASTYVSVDCRTRAFADLSMDTKLLRWIYFCSFCDHRLYRALLVATIVEQCPLYINKFVIRFPQRWAAYNISIKVDARENTARARVVWHWAK
jgi:hypothetical protein